MSDTQKAMTLMLDAFTRYLTDRENGTLPADDMDGDVQREPFLFPDEIAEILRDAGAGASVKVFDLFPDATEYIFRGEYDRDLTILIYDAIEDGIPVTVNGRDILTI